MNNIITKVLLLSALTTCSIESNAQNKILEEINGQSEEYYRNFHYNDKNLVDSIKDISFFPGITSFKYDDNNNLIEKCSYIFDTSYLNTKVTYTYDANNKKISEVLYNRNQENIEVEEMLLNSTTTFTYDGNGNLIKELKDLGEEYNKEMKLYKYNDKNLLISSTYILSEDENKEPYSKKEYVYDDNNRLIKSIQFKQNKDLLLEKQDSIIYTYDDKDNIIKYERFVVGYEKPFKEVNIEYDFNVHRKDIVYPNFVYVSEVDLSNHVNYAVTNIKIKGYSDGLIEDIDNLTFKYTDMSTSIENAYNENEVLDITFNNNMIICSKTIKNAVIYNIEGKTVMTAHNCDRINTSVLPSGCYILKANGQEMKFVK